MRQGQGQEIRDITGKNVSGYQARTWPEIMGSLSHHAFNECRLDEANKYLNDSGLAGINESKQGSWKHGMRQ
jgi:hypothetical protein